MTTKTKKRTAKVRSLREAKHLEAQIKKIREEFEEAERQAGDLDPTQDDEDGFAIERETDTRINGAKKNANDLFHLIEERLLPALEGRSTQRGTGDEGTGEGRTSEDETRTSELLRSAGIELSGEASPDLQKLLGLMEQQQREINLLSEQRTTRLGLGGYDGTRAASGDDPDKKFSMTRAVQGYLNNWQGWDKAFPEKEMVADYAQKAMNSGVSSTGGFLIAPTWMNDVIELLRPHTVALQLGMRTLPNLTGGPVQFAKLSGGATAYWVAEGKKATKSQASMGMLNLTPRPLVTVVPISEDLMESAPNASGIVEEDMALATAEAIDRGVMIGSGGEGSPLGIVNAPGIGVTDFSSFAVPTATDYSGSAALQTVTDLLDDMVFQLANRDAYKGSLGFALHPLALQILRKVKDHSGKPLLFNAMDSSPNSNGSAGLGNSQLWGHNFGHTTQLSYGAVTDILFGNWADLMLGRWGATKIVPSIHASDSGATDGASNAFLQRQVWIRMSAKVDVGLRHGESFQVGNGWAN